MRVVCLLAMCLLALLGCEFKGQPSQSMGANARGSQPSEGGGSVPKGQTWWPHPTAMRIYPSTRFVIDEKGPLLQARIELFDQMGDSIKSSGTVQFELHEAAKGANRIGKLLYQWRVACTSMKDQRQYYDPIFRGYEFHLRINNKHIAQQPTILQATFKPPNSDRLTTASRVRGDW